MLEEWPDIMYCTTGARAGLALFKSSILDDGRVEYTYLWSLTYIIRFSNDQDFDSHENGSGTDIDACQDKSISQIRSEGRTFNFVSSN